MNGITRRSLLYALGALPAARCLRAQEPQKEPQKPSFSTDVKVVNLFATVRNKKDQIVHNLTKDDFQLDEEGRPQTIKYFSQESNLPLTVGLLVDTSGSMRSVLTEERNASDRFLHQVLQQQKDLAFIIHFDFEVELLQDLTGSREALERALGQLQTGQPQLQRQGQGGGYPGGGGGYPGGRGGGGRRGGGGTLLYDAVFLGSDELMRKQSGRKAIILMSDGDDRGSKKSLFGAVESAQRADTLVYTIMFADQESPFGGGGFGGPRMGRRGGMGGPRMPGGNRPDGKKVMEQLAQETGGRFFEVSKKWPMDKVFAAIEEDLRSLYSLGYTPDPPGNGGYRHIHLATKQKDLIVQTREGYYPS